MESIISPTSLARDLGVSTVTLARWRRVGTGPKFVKLGRKVFYPQPAVAEWLQGLTVASNAELRQRLRSF